jgi:hypothetical protein
MVKTMNLKMEIAKCIGLPPSQVDLTYMNLLACADRNLRDGARSVLIRFGSAMAAELDEKEERGKYFSSLPCLLGPLTVARGMGKGLSAKDVVCTLNDWDKATEGKELSSAFITDKSEMNVTHPPLRPGDWVKVSGPGAVIPIEASSSQQSLMKYDPATGDKDPYPSHAGQYREYHPDGFAWLFNPWTGDQRQPFDIASDVTGLLIKESSDE